MCVCVCVKGMSSEEVVVVVVVVLIVNRWKGSSDLGGECCYSLPRKTQLGRFGKKNRYQKDRPLASMSGLDRLGNTRPDCLPLKTTFYHSPDRQLYNPASVIVCQGPRAWEGVGRVLAIFAVSGGPREKVSNTPVSPRPPLEYPWK